jgi:endonuclease/exonuclease/phosphatase family metal-dependent hydrolase
MKFRAWLILLASASLLNARAGETFRVAAYNVENYLDQPTAQRTRVKTDAARAKIRESIRTMDPDVLALEEMGTTNALLELRDTLKQDGLDFPYWEHIQGFDTNIHVAVLSKQPIIARRPHTNDFFLLDGKRFQVKRGFIDLEIQVATNFSFTLLTAHLKSQLSDSGADEAEQRLGEAKVLRGIIAEKLKADPGAKIIVAGDLNDGKDSESTKEIIGRGKTKLFDTRPAERNGDTAVAVPPYNEPRNAAWTYFYGKTDTYTRVDFILLSPAMKRFWKADETYIPKIPDWGIGSDHRPMVAGFSTMPAER